MARGLKFRILKVDSNIDPCSKNKGADQLRGYCEADLHLCFCICKKPVFSQRGSNRPYLESEILQMCMILTLILVSFERK